MGAPTPPLSGGPQQRLVGRQLRDEFRFARGASTRPRDDILPMAGPAGSKEQMRIVQFRDAVELVGRGIDTAGIGIMVVGVLMATGRAGVSALRHLPDVYRRFRQQLGRSILLGLELLVAADIIRTVAVTPTLSSVGVLALIVVIRTFLSFSLELEITGRWPWHSTPSPANTAGSS